MPQLPLFQLATAGKMLTVEVLEKLLQPAEMDSKRMVLFATHTVKRATMEWDQSAGNTALMDSQTLELIA